MAADIDTIVVSAGRLWGRLTLTLLDAPSDIILGIARRQDAKISSQTEEDE
jgi:hypothetical protein